MANLHFWVPFGGLAALYAVHLKLREKHVVHQTSTTILHAVKLDASTFGITMWAEVCFILSQFVCLTDRQMDGRIAHGKSAAAVRYKLFQSYQQQNSKICYKDLHYSMD